MGCLQQTLEKIACVFFTCRYFCCVVTCVRVFAYLMNVNGLFYHIVLVSFVLLFAVPFNSDHQCLSINFQKPLFSAPSAMVLYDVGHVCERQTNDQPTKQPTDTNRTFDCSPGPKPTKGYKRKYGNYDSHTSSRRKPFA